MIVITDDNFNQHNQLLNNDKMYMKVALKFELKGIAM